MKTAMPERPEVTADPEAPIARARCGNPRRSPGSVRGLLGGWQLPRWQRY